MAERPGRRAAEEQIVRVCTDPNLGAVALPEGLDQRNRNTTKKDSLTQVFVEVDWDGDRPFPEAMHTGPDRTVNPFFELKLSTFMAEDVAAGAGPGSVGRALARRRLQDTFERLQLRLESELSWDKGNTGILDVRYAGMTGEGEREGGAWPRLEYSFRFDVLIDVEVN